jgi:hypothetical protein
MRKVFLAGTAIVLVSINLGAAQETSGWPDTVRLLTREKSQATACVSLLKSVGNASAILEGRVDYGDAKASADATIAGFTTVLVQGGRPEDFPTFQTDIDRAGAGLEKVCKMAVNAAHASEGKKGLIDGIVTEAVKPVVDALRATASALWSHHIEMVELEREMIEKQLERATWPEFEK